MALQERQVVLNESLVETLEKILENQRTLKAQNDELRLQNMQLQKSLAPSPIQHGRRGKRNSKAYVPLELAKRFRNLYELLVKRQVIPPFDLDERPDSDGNNEILHAIKGEFAKENRGEDGCQWTDIQIETQFKTYYKTKKDRRRREERGTNEEHVKTCKTQRRINAKLERRMSAFQSIKSQLDERSARKMEEILLPEFMSSEESETEEDNLDGVIIRKRGFVVRKLRWERKKLTNMKKKLDHEYVAGLTAHARAMMQPRSSGPVSERAAPDGPSWAVRS